MDYQIPDQVGDDIDGVGDDIVVRDDIGVLDDTVIAACTNNMEFVL